MQPEAAARTADLAHIELLRSSGGGGGQVELNFTEEDYEKGSESLQAVGQGAGFCLMAVVA